MINVKEQVKSQIQDQLWYITRQKFSYQVWEQFLGKTWKKIYRRVQRQIKSNVSKTLDNK